MEIARSRSRVFYFGIVALLLLFFGGNLAGPADAAPTLVQTNSGANGANGTSITVSFATPPTAGNILVAILGNRSGTTIASIPSGWLNARQDPGPSPGMSIIYKVAGAGEPSDVTITVTVGTRLGLQIYEYTGIPNAVYLETAENSGSGTSLTSGTVTTTTNDELVVTGFTTNVATSFGSWTNSFIERNDFQNSGATISTYSGADRVASTPGSYATTATTGAAAAWRAMTVRFGVSQTIAGTVFEDVNYGGGAGRDRAISSGVGRSGARVELYDKAGAFVSSTTTDASGNYSFSGLAAGNYTVRVVNSSVTSSRTGYVAELLPVQTYCTKVSSGTAVAVTDYVGGQNPAVADAGNGAAGCTMNTATGGFTGGGCSGTAQSLANVTLGAADITGVDFGFNFDTIVNVNDIGQGSLRQFITNANTLGDDASLAQAGLVVAKENAVFMISNGTSAAGLRAANNYFVSGVATIAPASALPTVSTVVVLDAQKQPGWTLAPIIEVNGAGAGAGVSGLTVSGGSSSVRGIVINRFTSNGILLQTNGGNTVAGCYIGTTAAGAAAAANNNGILIVSASDNTIGGTTAADRNVISGNTSRGVNLNGATTSGTLIKGNYIGTNAAGMASVANGRGIVIDGGAKNNTVGGATAAERNVISGNTNDGVNINGAGVVGNRVYGNYLGVAVDGATPIPNSNGVYIMGNSGSNYIGGLGAGQGNVIALNNLSGVVVVAPAVSNAVSANSIYGNTQLGIDLGNNGVTANDGAKTAGQANLLMDFPVFTSAYLSGNTLTVTGYVGSAPNQATFANARVEIFKSDLDPSGYGEGRTYLGFLAADANGNFSGSTDVSGKGLAAGDRITGTATETAFNTSEFGANVVVIPVNTIAGTVFEDVNYGGGAGRDKATSSGVARSGARVELYDNAGAFVSSTTTDASGNYSFTNLVAMNYTVRVVNSTVTSSRTGYVAGLLPVQTYRTNASSGTAVAVTDYVGGQNPAVTDSGNGASGCIMNTSTGVFTGGGCSGTAQSIANVTLGAADVTGVDFGFNFDTIVNVNDTGQGSLRQFITNANTLGGEASLAQAGLVAGKENAVFMIPLPANQSSGGNSWWRISPASTLPYLTAANTVIDGTTQTINQGNTNSLGPEIELEGATGGIMWGIVIQGGSSTIRGLVINRFNQMNITMSTGGGNTIEGNYIGTNATGTATAGTSGAGISIGSGSSGNSIGGPTSTTRNVLSGNSTGISVSAAGANNTVRGNYIGINAAGTAAIPNGTGLYVTTSSGNTFGGTGAGEGNVISGNTNNGIYMAVDSNNNIFQGNTIGLDPTRTFAIPNGAIGIVVTGNLSPPYPTGNTFGGAGAGAGNVVSANLGGGIEIRKGIGNTFQGNTIYGNGGNGVQATGGETNAILRNSIYGNSALGIDLNNDGVTANDGAKPAGTPNLLMDFPVFTSATLSGTTLTAAGYVGSAANQATFAGARVEVFKSDSDPSGFGEGQTYLGFLTTDANGNFSGSLTVSGLAFGDKITGTATDGSNNTSEFGANVVVAANADLALTKMDNPDPAPAGGELLYTLLVTNNGPNNATNVVVTDNLPAGMTLISATPNQGSCSGTTSITCNLGGILSSGTASVEILVVTGTAGSVTNNATVTAAEADPVPGNNAASTTTQVVNGGTSDIPLTLYKRIHGFIDSTVTGGSLRTQPNKSPGNPCLVGASSTAALSGIPVTATVVAGYLYWGGSGSTVDNQVTLDATGLTADRTWTAQYTLSGTKYDYFGGFKDVTAYVQGKRNGNYTFSGLTVTTADPYCSLQAVVAGWSLVVIYEDPSASGKTLVLYDGFDLTRNGSSSYALSGIYAASPPEGKTRFVVWEGDETLSGATESLTFNGTTLSDALNPATNVYNSTINTLGVSTSYGVDIDSFDVSSMIHARDTLATTAVNTGPDLVILNAVLLQVKSNIIVGTVFEDVNYGGGAGRSLATATAGAPGFSVARPGVKVELYDSGGSLIRSTTTDADGEYGFAGLADGNYTVRVVNSSVTSSRPGAVGTLWPVQTYRTDSSSGTAVAVTNEVGGTNPQGVDAPANPGGANLGSFLAQSKATAKIITGITVTNVDFGFNFDTIVNTNDTGQGSLRQFITNASTLGGEASLAQSGSRMNNGVAEALPAGRESSIFMISDGLAHPGLRAGLANQLTGGVASISPGSLLPAISGAKTILDGTTQTVNVGDTNAGVQGTGVSVGVDGLVLKQIPKPEIEISDGAGLTTGLDIQASNVTIRGIAIYGFGFFGVTVGHAGIEVRDGSSELLIEQNFLGTTAASFSMPADLSAANIRVDGADAGIVRDNLIGYSMTAGFQGADNTTGWTIEGNEIRVNPNGGYLYGNGIDIGAANSGGFTIRGNLITLNSGPDIELQGGSGGNIIVNNTLTDAGTAGLFDSGVHIDGNGNIVDRNVIRNNRGAGVLVGSSSTGNRITRNSIYGNGPTTGQIGIDLLTAADNPDHGTSPFVTLNDSGDTDSGANGLLNFPILSSAVVSAGNLILTGYARPGSVIELFVADADPSGFGEGRTWKLTLTEGGTGSGGDDPYADTDAGAGTYGPGAINGIVQGTDTTNKFRFTFPIPSGVAIGTILTATATLSGNTSEFSGNVVAAAASNQPDAMIKLSSEADTAYLTDNIYEATVTVQVKSGGAVSGTTATYAVKFENDGNMTDSFVITGTGSGSGFTVQYLDETATDRTAAVTGAGYTIANILAGGSRVWTVNVTPAGNPAPVVGGTSYSIFVTVASSTDGSRKDQVEATTTSTSANLTLLKSADKTSFNPGEDITYTLTASNSNGLTSASSVIITDPVPTNTGFKIGGATFNAGTSTLAAVISYSNDSAATWVYTPVSGGCTAPAGYDYCVTNVKWTMTGSMPGGTNFSAGMIVRVK